MLFPIVLGLLYWDKTDKLGVFLGIVMIGMAVLFLIVVIKMGVDWESLGTGFLPNIPDKRENAAEPTDMVLSLVSTTAIGFNLFLGGSMGNDIGLGSVTGCRLWSPNDHRRHTEMHYVGCAKIKTNITQTDVITH